MAVHDTVFEIQSCDSMGTQSIPIVSTAFVLAPFNHNFTPSCLLSFEENTGARAFKSLYSMTLLYSVFYIEEQCVDIICHVGLCFIRQTSKLFFMSNPNSYKDSAYHICF